MAPPRRGRSNQQTSQVGSEGEPLAPPVIHSPISAHFSEAGEAPPPYSASAAGGRQSDDIQMDINVSMESSQGPVLNSPAGRPQRSANRGRPPNELEGLAASIRDSMHEMNNNFLQALQHNQQFMNAAIINSQQTLQVSMRDIGDAQVRAIRAMAGPLKGHLNCRPAQAGHSCPVNQTQNHGNHSGQHNVASPFHPGANPSSVPVNMARLPYSALRVNDQVPDPAVIQVDGKGQPTHTLSGQPIHHLNGQPTHHLKSAHISIPTPSRIREI